MSEFFYFHLCPNMMSRHSTRISQHHPASQDHLVVFIDNFFFSLWWYFILLWTTSNKPNCQPNWRGKNVIFLTFSLSLNLSLGGVLRLSLYLRLQTPSDSGGPQKQPASSINRYDGSLVENLTDKHLRTSDNNWDCFIIF